MTMIEKTWPIAEKLFRNCLNLTEQLHLELVQEADTLKKPLHTELINNITSNKKQLVMQLEQLNSQCSQILAVEKLPNNQEGIKEYFQRAEAAGLPITQSQSDWTQVQSLCLECRTLNEQNGASISLLTYHNRRSLHVLKAKTHSSNTYGSDGIIQNDPFTHTLILV